MLGTDAVELEGWLVLSAIFDRCSGGGDILVCLHGSSEGARSRFLFSRANRSVSMALLSRPIRPEAVVFGAFTSDEDGATSSAGRSDMTLSRSCDTR